jgi:hypothetical protein
MASRRCIARASRDPRVCASGATNALHAVQFLAEEVRCPCAFSDAMETYRDNDSMTAVRDLAAANKALETRAREWRRATLVLVGAAAMAGVAGVLGGLALWRYQERDLPARERADAVKKETADLGHGIQAVWGDALEAYAVGDDGYIAHHDLESGWHAVRSPTHATLRAIAVWGTGDARVGFAVGDGGTILRYSGATRSWSLEPSPMKENLHGVAAMDPVAIAVGEHGTLLVRDAWGNGASGWHAAKAPNVTLRAAYIPVHGYQRGPVYAVGDDGTILSHAFSEIVSLRCEPSNPYYDPCSRPDTMAFRLEGWHQQESGTHARLLAVGSANADVYVGGDDGTLIHTNVDSGTLWSAMPFETHDAFVSISSDETIAATSTGLLFAPDRSLRWGSDLAGIARAYDGDFFVATRKGLVTRVSTRRR